LKRDDDRAAFGKLIARADIFIHNLAPGSVERLGLGFDALKVVHPRLIWCGISGYGPDGPYRDKKAYDLLIQAESGVVSVTGTPNAPAKVGVSIADIAAGLYGYSSILTALWNRERTGCGERIDISMFECLTEWMMPPIYVWLGTGDIPARVGVRHNMIVPYGAYRCADGSVNFAIQNEREWARFCTDVLHLPALLHDERFATNAQRLKNRAELEALIEQQFARLSVSEAIVRLDHAEIANGAVNDVRAVANHTQIAERGRWVKVPSPNGMIPALLPPQNLMGAPPHMGAVPALGEHTQQVLAELHEGE